MESNGSYRMMKSVEFLSKRKDLSFYKIIMIGFQRQNNMDFLAMMPICLDTLRLYL
jgi:hypothetical protein